MCPPAPQFCVFKRGEREESNVVAYENSFKTIATQLLSCSRENVSGDYFKTGDLLKSETMSTFYRVKLTKCKTFKPIK